MRAIAVIFLACFIADTLAETIEEKKENFQKIRETCKNKNGINEVIIQKVKSGEQKYFDHQLKCYSACLFKKIGVMKIDGTINETVARARISAHVTNEKTEEILNQCRVPAENDHCEVAGKIMQCLVQTTALPIFQ